MKIYRAPLFASLFSALLACTPLALAQSSAGAVSSSKPNHIQQIIQLIGKTYDQPQHKVETAPVVLAGDFALADWIQGPKGGRALLRKSHGAWEIMACGGDGFTDPQVLQAAGIPADTAKNLIQQLKQAEQSLPAARVKQFGLFGLAGNDQPSHAAHPTHPAQHASHPAHSK